MRPGIVTTLLVIGACIVPEHGHAAPPRHKLAPPWPCTMANRMDMFVDEDDIMWECTCETLKSGHICRWQVIGGVEAVDTRKRIKRHNRTARTVRVVVRYAKPGVVG